MFRLEQAIDVLAAQGYQAIDISLEKGRPILPVPQAHMSPNADANTRRQLRKHAEQAGVTILALNATTNLIYNVPETRQANLKFVMGALELASDLGAKYVVTGGGSKKFYGRESQYWEWLLAALRALLSRANQLGVTLAFEAAGPYGRFVHNLNRVKHLLSCEGLEALRVVFDPSHYHLRGDSVVKAYEALSRHVVHVHTKDAKGDPEDFEFPPLGEGEVDFDGLLGAIVADGYDGYISVEYEGFAWGYESDCRKVLADSKSFINRILASKQNL